MDKDLRSFKEIFRVIKKGGYAYISVHGKGGIINDFTMKFLRPRYKNDKVFKKLIDSFLYGENSAVKFLKKNYSLSTKLLLKKLNFLFDEDLKLTIKDRLLAPKYKTYNEKYLIKYLKKIGFKKILRVKKKFNLQIWEGL